MSARTSAIIAIPVLNEEKVLRGTVTALRSFVDGGLPEYDVTIVVADNGSVDATEEIGKELASSLQGVHYLRLAERGKGLAIRSAWQSGSADICAFMDADLSTDLTALPELFRRVRDGADVAVGSRFLGESQVERSPFRRILSSGYRAFLRLALGTRIADAPCGFKAVSSAVVRDVMPEVRNTAWFFDSELVLRAERKGMRVDEIPVAWRDLGAEGRRSRVNVGKLIVEYGKEVWRLRRALGPGEPDAPAVTRGEWRFVLAIAAALVLATSIVPAYGALRGGQTGLEWTGRQSFSPGDLAAYLSQIAQARDGAFAFENLATVEPMVAVPHPVWWVIGLISRIANLAPLAAYHVGRIALIPLLVWASYAAISWFVDDRRVRMVGLALLCFGSGIGALVMPLLTPSAPRIGAYEWPTDLWVSESNVFASASYSPHFVASWALLMLALFLLSRALARRSVRDGAMAGLAAFALFTFHPFYAVTLYAVCTAWSALWAKRRGFGRADIGTAAAFIGLSVPAAAYHAWLAAFTPNGKSMIDANLLWTPSIAHVGIGLFGFLLLSPWGFRIARRAGGERAHRAEELAVWAVVTLALLYAPLTFQRRLIEGLQFPLAILAAWAVVMLALRIAALRGIVRSSMAAVAGIALYAIFLTTSVFVPLRDMQAYRSDLTPLFFFSEEESSALAWVRERSPRQATFLSALPAGNGILGWGERRAYLAHWALTPDVGEKQSEVVRFFDGMSSTDRAGFLARNGITHVYVGPDERALGADLGAESGLSPVFQEGEMSIFEVR